MARTGFIHHFGTFFLFVAVILLIVTDISAPVVADIALLRVELATTNSNSGRKPVITFGTFGWCTQNVMANGANFCTRPSVGYDPTSVLEEYLSITAQSLYSSQDDDDGDDITSDAAEETTESLTRAFVLHPIATVFAFVSFLLAAGSGFVGSFLASLGALLTFAVVLVAVVCDFVGLAIVRAAVSSSGTGASANWGSAAGTVVAAGVSCLLASIILFLTCCSARMHRQGEVRAADKA